jgi:hypothetical protein
MPGDDEAERAAEHQESGHGIPRPWKGREKGPERTADHDRAHQWNPEQRADFDRDLPPHGRDPVRQREREHADRREKQGTELSGHARGFQGDRDRKQQRHELNCPDRRERQSLR